MVLKKIVKSQSQITILRIFLKLLKSRSPMVVFYTKKKIYMDAHVDTKDYFDKYFEMSTILIIFFNLWIILVLKNSGKCPILTRTLKPSCENVKRLGQGVLLCQDLDITDFALISQIFTDFCSHISYLI